MGLRPFRFYKALYLLGGAVGLFACLELLLVPAWIKQMQASGVKATDLSPLTKLVMDLSSVMQYYLPIVAILILSPIALGGLLHFVDSKPRR